MKSIAARSIVVTISLIALVSPAAPSPRASDVRGRTGGEPTALELAMPRMTRVANDVWVGRVARGLWVHAFTHPLGDGTVFPANGMLLETRRGSIIVDPGWTDSQATALLDWARRIGKPVERAVVTHFHADRTGGIGALERARIPVLGLALTRELAAGAGSAALPSAVPGLESGKWRDPEGFELFYPGPGHSRDNIVVYFPRQRALFGGCFLKSVTATGLGNTADASVSEWPAAVERTRRAFPAARIVVPGHGTLRGDPLAHTSKLLRSASAAG
jgi:metallo-beta-lactamase class B